MLILLIMISMLSILLLIMLIMISIICIATEPNLGFYPPFTARYLLTCLNSFPRACTLSAIPEDTTTSSSQVTDNAPSHPRASAQATCAGDEVHRSSQHLPRRLFLEPEKGELQRSRCGFAIMSVTMRSRDRLGTNIA
jgi:hypothetical protein